MDNLTHTMAGLWVGEFAYRLSRKSVTKDSEIDFQPEKRRRRPWFWLIGVLTNNLPDIDFIFNPLLPSPINYLLHHRGFTHTLLGIVIQAPLVIALLLLIPAFRRFAREDHAGLRVGIVLAFVGMTMHLAFDSLNSYGVHPFYPISAKWFYGDMVFIIEPVMWMIFGIPFALTLHRWPRRTWYALLFGSTVVFGAYSLLQWASILVLWLTGTVLIATYRRGLSSTRAFRYSLVAFIGFLVIQGSFTAWANTKLTDVSRLQFANEKILDNSLSPFPSNPLCYSFVSMSVTPDSQTYIIRRGAMALLSRFIAVETCHIPIREPEESIAFNSGILWFTEVKNSIPTLSERAEKECYLYAWLRYSRMPDINPERALDARFQGIGRENFSTLRFANVSGLDCPKFVPPWRPPRQDLLDLGKISAKAVEKSAEEPTTAQ